MRRNYKMRNDISEKQILFDLVSIETRHRYEAPPEMPSEVIKLDIQFEQVEAFFGRDIHSKIATDSLTGDIYIYEWAMKEIDKFIDRQTKEDIDKCKEIANRMYKK